MINPGTLLKSKYRLYCHYDIESNIDFMVEKNSLFILIEIGHSFFKVLHEDFICYIPYGDTKSSDHIFDVII